MNESQPIDTIHLGNLRIYTYVNENEYIVTLVRVSDEIYSNLTFLKKTWKFSLNSKPEISYRLARNYHSRNVPIITIKTNNEEIVHNYKYSMWGPNMEF